MVNKVVYNKKKKTNQLFKLPNQLFELPNLKIIIRLFKNFEKTDLTTSE